MEPGAEMLRGTESGIRTYVLRQGRMTDAQKAALERIGPSILIPYEPRPLDLFATFGAHPLVLEIGFGMGQATWQIARDRPDAAFLGCEVHGPGVGRLLMDIEREGLGNLRIIQHDAVDVLTDMLPPGSLAGIHIFYPDPWQKKRHHKRRLMRRSLVDLMTARLAPGGYLYFVTDIEEYAQSTLEILSGTSGLRNTAGGFSPKAAWRPETKFERKAAKASRGVWELMFEATGDQSKKDESRL